MARKDDITKKGPMSGNNRSKALNATRRKWNLNLKNVEIKDGTTTKKVKVSARTARTLKKQNKLA